MVRAQCFLELRSSGQGLLDPFGVSELMLQLFFCLCHEKEIVAKHYIIIRNDVKWLPKEGLAFWLPHQSPHPPM